MGRAMQPPMLKPPGLKEQGLHYGTISGLGLQESTGTSILVFKGDTGA